MDSFLRKLYVYKFVEAFTLIFPVFTLFFQKAGLNTIQIGILLALWSCAQLSLEVPAGILADKYSRKNLLAIANICRAICFLLWLFGNFWAFALGFIFWGIKNALSNGTFEAFVFDELKVLEKEHLYAKVTGSSEGYRFLGVALSAVLGGFVAQYSFFWTLVFSVISSLLAAQVIFSIKPVKRYASIENNTYLHVLKDAMGHLKVNTPLLLTVTIIGVIYGTLSATDEFWALIYHNLGLQLGIIGTLIAIGYAATSFAGYTAYYFKSSKFQSIEYIFIFLSGILFLAIGFSKNIYAIPLVFLAIYLLQVANVKVEARLQHLISSKQRVTIISIKNVIYEVVYMFFVFLFGFLANNIGVISVLAISGSVIVLGTVAFAYIENLLENRKGTMGNQVHL